MALDSSSRLYVVAYFTFILSLAVFVAIYLKRNSRTSREPPARVRPAPTPVVPETVHGQRGSDRKRRHQANAERVRNRRRIREERRMGVRSVPEARLERNEREREQRQRMREARREMEFKAWEGRQKKEEAYRERLEAKRQARKGSAADVKSSFAKNGRAEWDALGGKGFSIEDRDKAQLSPEEKQRRETKIMAAIRERLRRSKVVLVDDVAVDVGLDPMDVTGHVEELVSKGRLSGVVDSAEGKFIHITEDEMEKVAAFIRAKGRFSVQEFCEESGRLIDLR